MKKIMLVAFPVALLAALASNALAVEVETDDSKCYVFANSAAAAHSMAADGIPLWRALNVVDSGIVASSKKSSKESVKLMRAFGRSAVLVGFRGFELGKDETETYSLALQACQMSNGGGL